MNGLVARLFAVVRALLETHVEQAKRELSRDLARVVAGVALLCFALVFATVTFLLVDVGAVLMLHDVLRLEWWAALLVVTFVNALVAVVLALVGRARLKGPVLQETRAMAKKTAGILRGTAASG